MNYSNRSVYENNQKDEFMKRLDDRVKQYDVEIEKEYEL